MSILYPGSLHNHTQYSNARLRDCIIKENDLIDYAIELGHRVVAITDHESVMNAVKVNKYTQKIIEKHPDFKIILGNEIYLCRNGLNATNFNPDVDKYYHFILLARDLIGHQQIREISTRAWKRSYMARGMRRVPTYYQDLFDIIGANPGHVIASTACLGGALGTQILRGTEDSKLIRWISQLSDLFGENNFYLEMQPSNNRDQIVVNKKILEFSREMNVPYIITTDSHYLKKGDRLIHKAYLNSQNGDREVDDFYATTYMMSDDELRAYFPYFANEIIENAFRAINQIADRCENYSLLKPLKIPELIWRPVDDCRAEYDDYFKLMPTLEKFANSPYRSDRYLVDAVIMGIKSHNDLQNERAYEALEDNLERTWESSEVNNARWSAYYLNLQKNIDECWNAGTLIGPARGSGGGFVLLYCLDVIQMNCLRETTQCFPWRFLNPKRASVLDIDTDIEGGKRAQVLAHLREVYGEDRVANVATFRTEKSKSAVLTAARGLGIDVDVAQYIASLIPADRGQLRSLNQCMYGDEDNGWAPIKQFVIEMTENYPELWRVASSVEGLVCGTGLHAGGVIFVDEPFTNSTALMRAPDGTLCTQFDLHDAEDVSLIKIDLLSVEALDKIHNCLDLLCDAGYIECKPTLRETYFDTIGLYNLERADSKMWSMVNNHEINALFQMEQQSGINGIALTHPRSVDELAVLNSIIRLMAPDKDAEQPLDMWARYRTNIDEWYDEMRQYGLSEDQIDWLSHHGAITSGVCESQEGLMSLLQDERLGGNDLSFADKCRKAIAKKQGKLFVECEEYYFKNAEEKGCDMKLVHYVWDVLLRVQRGYSFCRAHTLAYSLVALQEMNLAYRYPIMFWNTACLISDAGGSGDDEDNMDEIDETDANVVEETYSNEMEAFDDESDTEESSYDEAEDCDGFPAEVIKTTDGKKKKKVKTTNYGKIAAAIGKIKSTGITVVGPDINRSHYTFYPDIENNTIRYGLSGITRIGDDLIKVIMANRPYSSVADFVARVKINKTQMINLIKAGAFDSFGPREKVLRDYIYSVSDTKKRITLQNLKMLFDFDLIPEEFGFIKKVFYFNKYIKKVKIGSSYGLDDYAFNFYSANFDVDMLTSANTESGFAIPAVRWDNIYQSYMDRIRPFVKNNADTLLERVNSRLVADMWDKYCAGNISKWEMESVSFYEHEHELAHLDMSEYGLIDFARLPEQPEIDRIIPMNGKQVPIFRLRRICGTVLDRNKAKKMVTLLTTSGVVTVKIYGGAFAQYDKQISEKVGDKKKVIEKSMFSRGNKIIVTGMRDGDAFIAKKYKRTPYHLVEQIVSIDDYGNIVTHARGEED